MHVNLDLWFGDLFLLSKFLNSSYSSFQLFKLSSSGDNYSFNKVNKEKPLQLKKVGIGVVLLVLQQRMYLMDLKPIVILENELDQAQFSHADLRVRRTLLQVDLSVLVRPVFGLSALHPFQEVIGTSILHFLQFNIFNFYDQLYHPSF